MQLSRMSANPHFYDYMHFLDFQEDGSVEFVDGAGQAINTVAHGKYQVLSSDQDSVDVLFRQVVEVNPYQEEEKLNDIDDFTIRVTKENGTFPFIQEVVWKIEDEQEHPCLVYPVRYVFETDPLAFGRPNQMHNLYYIIESRELIESARYYYPLSSQKKLTIRQLREQGISLEQQSG